MLLCIIFLVKFYLLHLPFVVPVNRWLAGAFLFWKNLSFQFSGSETRLRDFVMSNGPDRWHRRKEKEVHYIPSSSLLALPQLVGHVIRTSFLPQTFSMPEKLFASRPSRISLLRNAVRVNALQKSSLFIGVNSQCFSDALQLRRWMMFLLFPSVLLA